MNRVKIAGTGSQVPSGVITNADLEKIVDTSDEWIVQRTGIRERRQVQGEETCSRLSSEAARKAMDQAGVESEDIDLIIVGTVSGDYPFPATACLVQDQIGAHRAGAFDVSAACSGFLYGLSVGWRMVQTGAYKNVLVIGAEVLTKLVDFEDRGSCILFGDGAGAVVLQASEGDDQGEILSASLFADGTQNEVIWIPVGGSRTTHSLESFENREHLIQLDGRAVFKFAVSTMRELIQRGLEENGITADQLKLVVPHQVNLRIIEAACKKLDLREEQVFINIEKYGNTSAASVPIALDEAHRSGLLEPGDLVLLCAFGAGLTWGNAVLRWGNVQGAKS
ncbi:MAG: beta-ketoacyl-ACP synthase III [Planctomycetota bacterium]|nr:beta-ketoacyl-ACP synthase III [Planctomycetota bacterium]